MNTLSVTPRNASRGFVEDSREREVSDPYNSEAYRIVHVKGTHVKDVHLVCTSYARLAHVPVHVRMHVCVHVKRNSEEKPSKRSLRENPRYLARRWASPARARVRMASPFSQPIDAPPFSVAVETIHLSPAVANHLADPALNPADAAEFAEQFAEFSEGIEAEIDRRAWHRTAQVLAEIGKCLTHYSSHSAAVAHALALHDPQDGTLALIGARLGISKQGVHKTVTGLRALFACSLPEKRKHIMRRPTEPGRWVTRPELRTEFRHEAATADALGVRSVLIDGVKFWDATHFAEVLAQREIAAARRRLARAVARHEISPAMPDQSNRNETKHE